VLAYLGVRAQTRQKVGEERKDGVGVFKALAGQLVEEESGKIADPLVLILQV
jgi:hypothetical protein